MKNAHLGGLDVSRIGLGAMTMAGTYTSEGGLDDAESIRTIHRALDLGVTHIDTAEVYGPFHSEEVVGRAVKGRRDEVVIATKFGLVSARRRRHPASSTAAPPTSGPPSRARCAGSAPTTSTCTTSTASTRARPIEETAGAVAELIAEGKVRHFGLSEAAPGHHPPRPRRAAGHRAADRVLAVDPRRRGRDPAAAARARHRLRALLARSATACSPGRSAPSTTSPTTTGARPTPASPARTSSATSPSSTRSRAIGAEIGATPAQTALAWLLTRGDDIAPIPGTRRVARVEENTAADGIELTADQLQRLDHLEPAAGERHDEANMASIDR